MNVIDVVKKYDLGLFEKTYRNQYGNPCNYKFEDLDAFYNLKVKGININFPTNQVTIIVIEEGK